MRAKTAASKLAIGVGAAVISQLSRPAGADFAHDKRLPELATVALSESSVHGTRATSGPLQGGVPDAVAEARALPEGDTGASVVDVPQPLNSVDAAVLVPLTINDCGWGGGGGEKEVKDCAFMAAAGARHIGPPASLQTSDTTKLPVASCSANAMCPSTGVSGRGGLRGVTELAPRHATWCCSPKVVSRGKQHEALRLSLEVPLQVSAEFLPLALGKGESDLWAADSEAAAECIRESRRDGEGVGRRMQSAGRKLASEADPVDRREEPSCPTFAAGVWRPSCVRTQRPSCPMTSLPSGLNDGGRAAEGDADCTGGKSVATAVAWDAPRPPFLIGVRGVLATGLPGGDCERLSFEFGLDCLRAKDRGDWGSF